MLGHRVTCALVLAIASWRSATAFAQGAGNLPQPISTRQASFAIPYTIPVPRTPAEQPLEIRLFASNDFGKTWNMADSAKLAAIVETLRGQFVFRAPQDGEYWFALRTVDRQGQLRGGRNGPELRVIVDSQPPTIQLDAQRGAAGEVAIRYQCADPALLPDSLTLACQFVGETDWRTIAFDKAIKPDPRRPLQGTAVFWPEKAGLELNLRAEIRDQATNVGTVQVRVPTAPGVAAQPLATNPQPTLPNSPPAQPNGTGLVRENDPPPAFPFGDTSQPGRTRWNDITNPTNTSNPTVAAPRYPPPAASQPNPQSGPALFGPGYAPAQEAPPTTALQPQTSPLAPRVESQYIPQPSLVNGPIDYRLPNGERPRMVNGRTFEWDYEIESIGASGIARVDLWLTRDAGRTWQSAGVDPDNRSPIRTTVDGEGVFGYRLTVQSAGGAPARAPNAGDQPEMWIGVDLTKPTARLINAELGTGNAAGEVTFTWETDDAFLAARPITLQYAADRNGPWTTIAAGVDNTGRYPWRYDARTPDRIYIRLEARDEAGNVGVSESVEALSLEQNNPTGKLRGVRPIGDGAMNRMSPTQPQAAPQYGNATTPMERPYNYATASTLPSWQQPKINGQPASEYQTNPYAQAANPQELRR